MSRQEFFDLLWEAVKNTNVDFYELPLFPDEESSVFVKFTGIVEEEEK